MKKSIFTVVIAILLSSMAFGQFRATDKTGINVFETPKTETEFNGVKVNLGGSFSQGYQTLNHTNADDNNANQRFVAGVDQNLLTPLVSNFTLASANLYLNTQLADGISLNLTMYLASRHHNETWVKGGYIQFDKIPFVHIDLLDNIMKYTTIKIGETDVNYGDAHYRRTDGGNAIYNPFVENYIMDEFATEVGAEADFQYKGFLAVGAITDGELKGDINYVAPVPEASNGVHKPAFIGKLGFDKQLNKDLRVRLTGSAYYTAGSIANTLFGGDRTGSHYFGVIDYAAPSTSNAFSGRYNPGFTDKLATFMGNLFVKYHGLEWFSTLESASGRARTETTGDRKATQFATDLVYRFGSDENFWLGARYNTLKAGVPASAAVAAKASPVTTAVPSIAAYDGTINRFAVSAGWFMTKNVMAKVEYVNQDYKNLAAPTIYNDANFKGFVLEAVVGF
jgi:hypothetical protein